MQTKSFSDMRCSVARALEDVGSWWSLLIIREAMLGRRRFREFETALGISKNTLSRRLSMLVESGVLEKAPAEDGSAHPEYLLTAKGSELAPVMIALAQWGDKWATHEDGPPYAFVDKQTGREIAAIWPRREDGAQIPLRDITVKPLTSDAGPDGEEGR